MDWSVAQTMQVRVCGLDAAVMHASPVVALRFTRPASCPVNLGFKMTVSPTITPMALLVRPGVYAPMVHISGMYEGRRTNQARLLVGYAQTQEGALQLAKLQSKRFRR